MSKCGQINTSICEYITFTNTENATNKNNKLIVIGKGLQLIKKNSNRQLTFHSTNITSHGLHRNMDQIKYRISQLRSTISSSNILIYNNPLLYTIQINKKLKNHIPLSVSALTHYIICILKKKILCYLLRTLV